MNALAAETAQNRRAPTHRTRPCVALLHSCCLAVACRILPAMSPACVQAYDSSVSLHTITAAAPTVLLKHIPAGPPMLLLPAMSLHELQPAPSNPEVVGTRCDSVDRPKVQ